VILCGRQTTRPAGSYSAGLADIIKMLDARLDAAVILAYIQHSPIPYNPEATELIALREHGASTETLIALLHRGDELRLQLAQAQSAVNPPPAAPAYDTAPEAAYPPYPYEYPEASGAPYPAIYYSYGYGWPWAYRPYGPYRNRAGAAPLLPLAAPSVSAPGGEHASSPAAQSGGSRSSGHSGERSGARSR
jgi:hypothetical protein